MALSSLLTRTVTIRHTTEGTTLDDYGNPVKVVVTSTSNGEIQQRTRREEDQIVPTEDWLLILPADATIDTNDTIVVDGLTFEAIGPPWPVWNPRLGATSHLEVTVRKTG